MYEVRISDGLYEKAKQAAQAQEVSIEAFVEQAVELHLENDEDAAIQRMFTPERLAHIAKARAEIDAGKGLSIEQVDESLAASRAEWLAAHQR